MNAHEIDHLIADFLTEQFDQPIYLFDMRGVLARYQAFQEVARSYYHNSVIALSYKTNPIFGLLKTLHQEGAFAEVVSGYEYEVAESLNVSRNQIIFNGPMKTDSELRQAIEGESYINCDHEQEIFRILKICQELNCQASIGLRLSFHERGLGWSRFGFSASDKKRLYELVSLIQESQFLELGGLHTHIGTNIREIAQFQQLGKGLAEVATDLLEQFQIELQWLDVGGGLAGISPRIDEQQLEPHSLPSLKRYVQAVTEPLLPYLHRLKKSATLFFEPGRTLLEPFGMMLTQVVGIRPAQKPKAQAVILNAGNNLLATTHVYNHPLRVLNTQAQLIETELYGPSCNQVDQLHQSRLLPKLEVGDHVLFYGVGAYCMAFSHSFIRLRPGVVAWYGDQEAEWLRLPESFSHLRALECLPQKTMTSLLSAQA